MKNIICIGGANIDRKLISSCTLQIGTSNPVSSYSVFGGVARNVAENLGYWTKDISLQCLVGDDSPGRELLVHMQKMGINIDQCRILSNQKTPYYYAIHSQNGELYLGLADMAIYDHISESSFTESWKAWNANTIVFIDTNLSPALIQKAISHCLKCSAILCIDPVSVVKSSRLPQSLEGVYLLKPNHDETRALTGLPLQTIADCLQAGRQLIQRGVENVVISLGRSGYVIVNSTFEEYVPAVQFSEVNDVCGAGDAFIAGVLFGLQQNASLIEACELGAAAAAFTIQSHKTVVDDITAPQLRAFVNNQKKLKEHPHAAHI
ncbi:MAG: carbohydrate kinase family protein [Rickettsiales bacterium]